MQEKEQLDNLFGEITQENKAQAKIKKIIVIACVLGSSFYLFLLLFGSNSWSVLLDLKNKKNELEKRVEILQNENVELQKTIFEFKGLEPQNEEQR